MLRPLGACMVKAGGIDAQDLVAGPVAAAGKGCYWNQDVGALLAQARLRVVKQKDALGGLITMIEAERA